MSAHRGIIPGDTPLARATALAGALAELSQTRLILAVNGAEVEVAARVTNLPGVLAEEVERCSEAHVAAPALGATFRITTTDAHWECADPHVAEQLQSKFHA